MVGVPVNPELQGSGRSSSSPRRWFLAVTVLVGAALGIGIMYLVQSGNDNPGTTEHLTSGRVSGSDSDATVVGTPDTPTSTAKIPLTQPTVAPETFVVTVESSTSQLIATSVTQQPTTAQVQPPTNANPTTTTSTALPPPSTQSTGCTDSGSWAEAGPVVLPPIECPESPFGTPSAPENLDLRAGWVVLVDAEPIDSPNAASRYYDAVRDAGFAPKMLDSRRHLGLRDPYWTVVIGPMQSEAEAVAWCQENWAQSFSDDGACKARLLDGQPPTDIGS
jgi:hypothetical protein